MIDKISENVPGFLTGWTSRRSYLLLAALTLLSLLPFSGRAFHVDDPLFIWSAQQIVKHPLDPYGFQVLWDNFSQPMSEVTKNPPLACYYAALIGSLAGWSERALHLGFLLPALALVLGTYRLSLRFTRSPLIAAAATLLTPGVLVSASSVMCDVMMLAIWVWATIFWLEGFDQPKHFYLGASALLLSLAALTKYFGLCLLPLLLTYSLVRKRRIGWWASYFVFPILVLAGYQLWTTILYGHAMFSEAVGFAELHGGFDGKISSITTALVAISFVGGCTLSVVLLSLFVWRWNKLLIAIIPAGLAGFALSWGWLSLTSYTEKILRASLRAHWLTSSTQLAIAIAGGLAVLCAAATELRKWRDSDSVLLSLWVIGTFMFTAFVNWTVNARSVLPLIPAAAILMARRLDEYHFDSAPQLQRKVALALLLSGTVSFWLAKADTDLANSAKKAAEIIHQQSEHEAGDVWFQGHWGFQYYMQLFGARPLDFLRSDMNRGDVLVVPENNADAYRMPSPQFVGSESLLEIKLPQPISTMRWRTGAAFYASYYGPLPFAFGEGQSERYYLIRLSMPLARRIAVGGWHGPRAALK